jgi:type IV pilus assembly protein PilA
MNLAAAAKAAVAETFLNRGTAPANRTVAGMSPTATDTNGKYVASVEVTNGTITVTYGHEANSQINTQTLNLVPYITNDRSVAWKCGGAAVPGGAPTVMTGVSVTTGGTLAGATLVKYLPSACRP